MRIPVFAHMIRKHAVEEAINGSTLVIDGQNYFYDCYEKSKLSTQFGCESDKYFKLLKENLKKFIVADVKCYFIFMGGHKDTEVRELKASLGGSNLCSFKASISMWDVHREILDDMGFQYAYCEFEAKAECFALARLLKCPIVSNDIECCFAGVPYINHRDLPSENTQTLITKVFRLDRFLSNTGLDKSKLAIFAVLFNEHGFSKDHFMKFTRTVVGLYATNYLKKYESVFRWLKRFDSEVAIEEILNIFPKDRDEFMERKEEVMNLNEFQRGPGVVSQYLLKGCKLEVKENDPLWFTKGVAATITLPYVNLYYKDAVAELTVAPMTLSDELQELEDPLLLSTDIIRYAYDLLKNFPNTEFVIKSNIKSDVQRAPLHIQAGRIAKPEYEANESVFENGWEHIKQLKLFEHFLIQQFQGFPFDMLNRVPEDAKLLMISLFYFKRFSSSDEKAAIMHSVLFSYVNLGVVNQEGNDSNNDLILSVTEDDKEAAKLIAVSLFSAPAAVGTDLNMIHSLTEFQHCLSSFRALNDLCGSPYQRILFSKMYNGALVFNVTRVGWSVLENRLRRAPTVLNLMNVLFDVFNNFN